MNRRLLLLAAVIHGAAQAGGKRLSQQQAEQRFRAFWRDFAVGPQAPPAVARLTALVRSAAPALRRVGCDEHRALARDRLGNVDQPPGLLYGHLSATQPAQRGARCWTLFFDGPPQTGLAAAVDDKSGDVLLVWETPGG